MFILNRDIEWEVKKMLRVQKKYLEVQR